jgi:Kef-type K+ transport system membrane component KefB
MESTTTTTVVFYGISTTFPELYFLLWFFVWLYIAGDVICRQWLRIVPSLTGQILLGMALGPDGWNSVLPEPSGVTYPALVLLGNIGLALLILQAGLEMDVGILRLIGPRGVWIAIVGSILPIGIGISLTLALGYNVKTAIATGCCFGPTSAGIAMNVLGQCEVLQKPIGQLIVAAAIVDDMIALIVLSQLEALTGNMITVTSIITPIVSALLWFVLGGFMALFVMPKTIDKLIALWKGGTELVRKKIGVMGCCLSATADVDDAAARPTHALVVMMALFLALMLATYFSQASFLLGAFLAGLSNCRNDALGAFFSLQHKRIIQWLMRLFFAASIGFQVPVSLFGNGAVLWKGVVLMLSLCGKLAVGPLLTPKLDQQNHWRDCAVVGFSMAGEAEFAFVIAVFGVTNDLIDAELYASVIFAILLSTILSPLLLRTTLALFPYDDDNNRLLFKAQGQSEDGPNATTIDLSTCCFWHIQIQSHASWGSLQQLLQSLLNLDLEIVNHRSWHQRHSSDNNDTDIIWMWNDIYALDDTASATPPSETGGNCEEENGNLHNHHRLEEIKRMLRESIQQPVSNIPLEGYRTNFFVSSNKTYFRYQYDRMHK